MPTYIFDALVLVELWLQDPRVQALLARLR
jgi:hypothetical protein